MKTSYEKVVKWKEESRHGTDAPGLPHWDAYPAGTCRCSFMFFLSWPAKAIRGGSSGEPAKATMSSLYGS